MTSFKYNNESAGLVRWQNYVEITLPRTMQLMQYIEEKEKNTHTNVQKKNGRIKKNHESRRRRTLIGVL